MRRHELLTDHPPHHPAAGAAHGFPHAGQYADRYGQGYLAGREHHRDRNVHDDPAHCARTYEPLALYIEVGLVYLLFCTVLTRLQAVGERYLNSKGAQRS